MSRKRTVEKIDGFKTKTTKVVRGSASNSFSNATGADCPIYPYTKASIDSMTCDQITAAYEQHLLFRSQAVSRGDTCVAEWNDLNVYLRSRIRLCGIQGGSTVPCTATVSSVNVNTDASGTATIVPVLNGATSYGYLVLPTNQAGTKNAGESLVINSLPSGSYEVTIKPKCANGVTGITKSKSFPVVNKSATTTPTPTTTITTTTTSTPIISGIGGMFGGGLGQELSDQGAVAPKKYNWLFWVLVAGAVYLFTRKKKKD